MLTSLIKLSLPCQEITSTPHLYNKEIKFEKD